MTRRSPYPTGLEGALRHLAIASVFALASCATGPGDAGPSVPLDRGLDLHGVTLSAAALNGHDAARLNVRSDHRTVDQGGCESCTFALVEGVDFKDGTIEIDLAGRPVENAPPFARGFVGIVFRATGDGSRFEGVYFRPVNAIADDPVLQSRSVQYFSYPDHGWRKLRTEFPGKYEAAADIAPGEWFHLRLEVAGGRAAVFVDDAEHRVLEVEDLKLGPDARGAVGLFTKPATDAFFRNLQIRHSD